MARPSIKAWKVKSFVLERIRAGEFLPGSQLPSERDLAQRMSLNQQTVRRGLEQLVEEEIILKQPRVGNFVHPELRLQATTRIAVCVSQAAEGLPSISFSQLFASGLRQTLPDERFRLMPFYYEPDRFEEQCVESCLEHQCRGMVLMRGGQLTLEHLDRLAKNEVAVCSVGRPRDQLVNKIHWVDIDQFSVVTELVEGLVARGHRHVLVARYEFSKSVRPGLSHIRSALRHLPGLDSVLDVIDLPNPGITADWSPAAKALESLPPRTAIIMPDELAAASLLRAAYQKDLSVPRDFSLAVVHNHIPELHPLSLTSLHSREVLENMATHAGDILKKVLQGQPPSFTGCIFPFTLQWTESVSDWRFPTKRQDSKFGQLTTATVGNKID